MSAMTDIAKHLESKGIGIYDETYFTGQHDIFKGKVRPNSEYIPVKSIFVSLTPSRVKPEKEFSETYRIRTITAQVIVRGSKDELDETETRAKNAFDAMDYADKELTDYMRIEPISDILWLGYDENEFPRFSFNLSLRKQENI